MCGGGGGGVCNDDYQWKITITYIQAEHCVLLTLAAVVVVDIIGHHHYSSSLSSSSMVFSDNMLLPAKQNCVCWVVSIVVHKNIFIVS